MKVTKAHIRPPEGESWTDYQDRMFSALLANIKRELPELEKTLAQMESHWNEEDMVYRFYHHSFKVYHIQGDTADICAILLGLSPHEPKAFGSDLFVKVMNSGCKGRAWHPKDNKQWARVTRPMLESFWHALYFLKMAVKYGKQLNEPPGAMPSGWAALAHLYGIR